jgi:hypothetical protein
MANLSLSLSALSFHHQPACRRCTQHVLRLHHTPPCSPHPTLVLHKPTATLQLHHLLTVACPSHTASDHILLLRLLGRREYRPCALRRYTRAILCRRYCVCLVGSRFILGLCCHSGRAKQWGWGGAGRPRCNKSSSENVGELAALGTTMIRSDRPVLELGIWVMHLAWRFPFP